MQQHGLRSTVDLALLREAQLREDRVDAGVHRAFRHKDAEGTRYLRTGVCSLAATLGVAQAWHEMESTCEAWHHS